MCSSMNVEAGSTARNMQYGFQRPTYLDKTLGRVSCQADVVQSLRVENQSIDLKRNVRISFLLPPSSFTEERDQSGNDAPKHQDQEGEHPELRVPQHTHRTSVLRVCVLRLNPVVGMDNYC